MVMAVPVLTGLAAAAATKAAGYAAYAAIAYTVASTAASMALAKKTTSVVENGKMTDIKEMKSSYGVAIPEIFGTVPVSGNVIWASKFKEHVNETVERQGGKGVGGSKIVNKQYYYTCSFAMLICKGEVSNLRWIEINGKKVLELGSEEAAYTPTFKTNFEFFKGTKDQLPCQIIENYEGEGNVEAYRDLCYIVFENMNLSEYNNQIPNIIFGITKTDKDNITPPTFFENIEVVQKSQSEIPNNHLPDLDVNNTVFVYNSNDKCLYAVSGSTVLKYNVIDKKVIRHILISNIIDINSFMYKTVNIINNDLVIKGNNSIYFVDCNTLTLKKELKLQGDINKNITVNNLCDNLTIGTNQNITNIFYNNNDNCYTTVTPLKNGDLNKDGVILKIYADLLNVSQTKFSLTKSISNNLYKRRLNSIVGSNYMEQSNTLKSNSLYCNFLLSNQGSSSNQGENYKKGINTFLKDGELYYWSLQASNIGFDGNITNPIDSSFKMTLNKILLNDSTKIKEDCDVIFDSNFDEITDKDFINIENYNSIQERYKKTEVLYFDYNELTNDVVAVLKNGVSYKSKNDAIRYGYKYSIIKYNIETKEKIIDDKSFFSDLDIGYMNFNYDKIKNELHIFFYDYIVSNTPNINDSSRKFRIITYKIENLAKDFSLLDSLTGSHASKLSPSINTYINDINCLFNLYIRDMSSKTTRDYHDVRLVFETFKKGKYSLDKLVKKICLDNNLKEEDIDVSSLSSDKVRGFIIKNETTARDSLEQLAQVFNFDITESDYVIKFVKAKNNSNVVKRIKIGELNAINFSSKMNFDEGINIVRQNELSLPKTININYIDEDKNYEQNTQDYIKQTTNNLETLNINASIVLSANEAKNRAAELMYQSYIQRDVFTFTLNYNHLDLEPTDIIEVETNESVYTLKIIKIETDSGIIKVEALAENKTVYNQNFKGEIGKVYDNKVKFISKTSTLFLDIPILNNYDNDLGFYVGAIKNTENAEWSGSYLLNSLSLESNFNNVTTFTKNIKIGSTKTKLGNFQNGFTVDSFNDFEVYSEYELSSVTDEDFLSGKNLALVGNEIIAFQNAELIAYKTYKISGLIRGMFGMEDEISKHNNSEKFIILNDTTNIQRVNSDLNNVNTNYYYKNVTFNDNLNETVNEIFKNSANGVKCYKVNNILSNRNSFGDINVNFDYRSRGLNVLIDGGFANDLDTPKFEIEVYSDVNYTTLVDTIVTTNNNFTYTASKQQSIFGSNQNGLNIIIYKINSYNMKNEGVKVTV